MSTAPDTPIACRLDSAGLRDRRAAWAALATGALLDARPIDAGVRLVYRDDAEVRRRLEALIALEADCCAFARFELVPAEGAVRLDVTADGVGAEAVRELFGEMVRLD